MPIQWTRCPTLLGTFDMAWSEQGIRRIQLPGNSTEESFSIEGSQPPFIRDLCERLTVWARGFPTEFQDIPLDLPDISPFARAVYNAVRTLSYGRTSTYGRVASAIGRPGSARAVGAALGANPTPIVVPCHRILGASGALIGFSAPGGLRTKQTLLDLERGSP